jgi:BirA family biotin operon repressor/biotin-[acetyl-CoA-carboxylase] ligase
MPSESSAFLPLDGDTLTTASPWNVPVQVLSETTSSNDELLEMGEEGAPAGTLLFAELQSAGRGQFRRPWSSAPGLGLWFSLLLRLPINDAMIPLLSAFPAVALVEVIRDLGVKGCVIKSPNDVLIEKKKVAGILVETRTGKDPFAVVGIGLNVNHSSEDFPEELQHRACSLAMACKSPLDRTAVAVALITKLGIADHLMRESPEELLAIWNQHLLPS